MALPQDVGGIIHLAQLPPFKPHSVAPSIPQEAAGVASDTETVCPPKGQEAPGLLGKTSGGSRPLGGARPLPRAPCPLCTPDTCPQVPPRKPFRPRPPQAGLGPPDGTVMAYCPQRPAGLVHPGPPALPPGGTPQIYAQRLWPGQGKPGGQISRRSPPRQAGGPRRGHRGLKAVRCQLASVAGTLLRSL